MIELETINTGNVVIVRYAAAATFTLPSFLSACANGVVVQRTTSKSSLNANFTPLGSRLFIHQYIAALGLTYTNKDLLCPCCAHKIESSDAFSFGAHAKAIRGKETAKVVCLRRPVMLLELANEFEHHIVHRRNTTFVSRKSPINWRPCKAHLARVQLPRHPQQFDLRSSDDTVYVLEQLSCSVTQQTV